MNNIIKKYIFLNQINSKVMKVLIWILLFISILGILLTLTSILLTGFQEHQFEKKFCFNNTCIKNALDLFSQSILIMQATFVLLGIITTIGGIVVALLSYINSVSVSALGNHISHFKIFQDYLSFEISKRNRLSTSSFDIFKWYNIIYNKSRSGLITVSPEYLDIINELNLKILESNFSSSKASNGSYSYVTHQINIISILKKIGISQARLPRNDFYEVEEQVLGLIENINREFCYSGFIPEISKRRYI